MEDSALLAVIIFTIMTTIFVFAYYSYKDPVFQSAVLSYLRMLSSSELRFVILTWEQDQFKVGKEERHEIRSNLRQSNILWHDTKWHSGKLKILKKAYDLIKGMLYSCLLILRYDAKRIYTEGFPGAIIGHYLSKIVRRPHIIHTFEPHADYMAEAGVWKKDDWEYRLLKKLEVPIAIHAETIITGTSGYKELLSRNIEKDSIRVIPSCVDTTHYRFLAEKRRQIRLTLGLKDNDIVIVYLGKIGGMYMDEELFDFFKLCLSIKPEGFFFFLFTNGREELIRRRLGEYQIPDTRILFKYLSSEKVPDYLSAADIGFCAIRPIPNRRFSSPIKTGEYWACGLPILIPQGISDDYLIAQQEGIGFSFKNTKEITLEVMEKLKNLDRQEIARKGFRFRGLKRYRQEFFHIFRT